MADLSDFKRGQIIGARMVAGSDDNEGVLRISQSSSVTGTSQSDCLVP